MNKKELKVKVAAVLADEGRGGLSFIASGEKMIKSYRPWLRAQRKGGAHWNPYHQGGLILEDKYIKEFIYKYQNNLGGLCNHCEVLYVNGVKLQ